MRISSGIWRGRNIFAPAGKLKPTSDKVRQAFFNAVRSEITGASFLDLYAGSGSVGITALSEGASHAVFVENDSQTYKALRQNLQTLAEDNTYDTFRADVENMDTFLSNRHFDIIFADPFYPDVSKLILPLYNKAFKMLNPEGIFVLEHGKKIHSELVTALEGYSHTKTYGDTALSFFKKL
ncbi:MAG: 16S rRNA (guanine(966)-N(2))-methyltransferase RsmD [Brevinemataceae bacterium]